MGASFRPVIQVPYSYMYCLFHYIIWAICTIAGSFMKNMMPTASMLRTEHQKHQKKAMQYAIPGSPRACVADVDDSNSSENEQIRISPDNAARVFLTGSKKSSPTTASEHVTPTKLPIDAVAGANTTDDALWSTRVSTVLGYCTYYTLRYTYCYAITTHDCVHRTLYHYIRITTHMFVCANWYLHW